MDQNIFSGDYAEIIYPAMKAYLFDKDKAGEYAVRILDRFFSSKGKNEVKVIELCCGDGTDAKIIQDAGYSIDVLDGSKEFVDMAVKKLEYKSNGILSDVTKGWSLDPIVFAKYDAAICLMSSVLIKDFDSFVTRVRDSLKNDGIFAFDFRNVMVFAFHQSNIREEQFGEIKRTVVEKISNNKREATYKYSYPKGGVVKTLSVSHTSFLRSTWQIAEILKKHCFEIVDMFNWNTFEKAAPSEDENIMVIARKR